MTTQPEEERRLHDLSLHLKALDVGLWTYNLDTDVLSCDERWYGMLQLEPGSVTRIGAFRPHIHPDDAGFATAVNLDGVADMIASDRRYHIDFRVIRCDGEVRWWRSVACLQVEGGTGHRKAIGCVTDVTEFLRVDRLPAFAAAVPAGAGSPVEQAARSVPSNGALSARELECLRWVSVGKTAWETAIIMGRSQRTVEFHLLNAVRKLAASNKIHAAVIAVRRGLI